MGMAAQGGVIMKNERLAKILQLIASEDIGSQEELVKRLNEQGMSVTQATVSRDIKDLRLTKVRTEKGGFRYVAGLPAASAEQSNETALAAKQAGNNMLVKDHRFSIQNGVLLKYLGADADVVIPENVNEIAKNAFYRKTTPVTITIPSTVKVLQPYALAECKSLEKLIIEPGRISIPSNFCNCCKNLKEVILPEGIVEIGERAFHACQLFHIDLPNSVKVIGDCAFWETPLTEITLPEGIESIGHGAFDRSSISEIVIPKSCQFLGDNMCYQEKLKTMVICSDDVMPKLHTSQKKRDDKFSTNFLFDSFLDEKDKQNPKTTIYCSPSVKKRLPKCWSGKIRPLSEWIDKKGLSSDGKNPSERISIYKLADEAVRKLFLGDVDPAEVLENRQNPRKSIISVETDHGTIEVINRAYSDIQYLVKGWLPGGYDMYDAMDHYLSKEAVAARINIFDDGHTDAAFYAKPEIDRTAPSLTKEQVATRLLLLLTVVDKCLNDDVLKQIIASMPKKKDGTLMKNRVTRIASGNIVSQDAEVLEFTAKADAENSIILSVGYRPFSGEELSILESDFLSTRLLNMKWDLDSNKMQEAIRASKYPSRAKAIRELRKAYLSGHDEWAFEWKKRFNEDPVFKSLAISLVWLLRERIHTKCSFMVKEDGRCVSCDGAEVVIPDHFRIAVAYGPHLEDDELLKWKAVFGKEGIEQLFMQLDETRFDPKSLEFTNSPTNDYKHDRTSDGDKIVTRYDGIDVFYGFLKECLNDGYDYQAFSYQVEQICFPNDTTYMWAPMENRYSSYPYEDLSSGETIHLGEMFLPAFHAEDSVFSRPINHFLFMMDRACLKDAIDKHDLSLLQARAKFLSPANIGECIELAKTEKAEDCLAWLEQQSFGQ